MRGIFGVTTNLVERYIGIMKITPQWLFTKVMGLKFTKRSVVHLIKSFGVPQSEKPWKFSIQFPSGLEIDICVHKKPMFLKNDDLVKGGSYQRYERKGRKYMIGEILPLLTRNRAHIMLDGDSVGVSSLRLLTFGRYGTKCVSCGMEGKFFIKERHRKGEKSFHLNLYGYNEHGSEILMTSDHIIPRSKGGSEGVQNRQPMCIHCNNKKADTYSDADRKKGAYKDGLL